MYARMQMQNIYMFSDVITCYDYNEKTGVSIKI